MKTPNFIRRFIKFINSPMPFEKSEVQLQLYIDSLTQVIKVNEELQDELAKCRDLLKDERLKASL